ncbi:hypothetical protein ACFQ0G_12410 [Streptomyces chiangmaiensis]|uniref:hypothetical protein n=1 Tax=Streptomyces chiangmaiensis TaxID=766497 RepID=UPI0031E8878C
MRPDQRISSVPRDSSGEWWEDCYGELRLVGEGPSLQQDPWEPGRLKELVDAWY